MCPQVFRENGWSKGSVLGFIFVNISFLEEKIGRGGGSCAPMHHGRETRNQGFGSGSGSTRIHYIWQDPDPPQVPFLDPDPESDPLLKTMDLDPGSTKTNQNYAGKKEF